MKKLFIIVFCILISNLFCISIIDHFQKDVSKLTTIKEKNIEINYDNTMYATFKDKYVFIKDINTNEVLITINFKDFINCIAFNPQENIIAVGSYYGARLYNTLSGSLIYDFKIREEITSISYNPDGTKIVIATSNKSLLIYNLSYKKLFFSERLDYSIEHISFTPNDKIVLASRKKVFIFNEDLVKIGNINFNVKINKLSCNPIDDECLIVSLDNQSTILLDVKSLTYSALVNTNKSDKIYFSNYSLIISDNSKSEVYLLQTQLLSFFNIDDIKIIDGNKNNIIESDEVVAVKITFNNQSIEKLIDVTVQFYFDQGYDMEITNRYPSLLSIGDVESYQSKNAYIEFIVSAFADRESNLICKISAQGYHDKEINIPIIKDEVIIQDNLAAKISQEEIQTTVNIDIESNIPQTSSVNNDAIAIIIGNKEYKKTKDVEYSIRDALLIKEYVKDAFGYKERNIFFLENASKGDFDTYFGSKEKHRGKLYNLVKSGISDVFVYYSGHGAPSIKDQEGCFVPVECDPRYVELGGYSINTFYKNLSKIQAKSITVILDACFSGVELIEYLSPIIIKIDNPLIAFDNGVVITSSKDDEPSSWYNENKHGMFTYFFLKAIHNKNADFNKDKKLTFNEIYKYISDNNEGVPYYSRRIHGFEQNPQIFGQDRERVLIEYE